MVLRSLVTTREVSVADKISDAMKTDKVVQNYRKRKGKGVDMKPYMQEHASKDFNPFDLVTHINGKRIK